MNQYQLRIYTLADVESLSFFKDVVYPRHLENFLSLQITPHGIWTNPENPLELYVLVSYLPEANVDEIGMSYMSSPAFADAMRDMDISKISPRSIALMPSASSPLR